MDPKKAITERTEAAARDLYGARPAERLRPVGYMQIETRERVETTGLWSGEFPDRFRGRADPGQGLFTDTFPTRLEWSLLQNVGICRA